MILDLTNKDYYTILTKACKEAFEVLETRDYLYSYEAMIENNEITLSKEYSESMGSKKANNLIVQYRLKTAIEYAFLTSLERQYLYFKQTNFFERKDFYRKCLTALNVEITKFINDGNFFPISYDCTKQPLNELFYLESSKIHLKARAELPDKISQIMCNNHTTQQQLKAVSLDEVKNELHPKHDPNLWNNDCFELFKYLYDCYYKNTKRQITNIWFYLKDHTNDTYVLKATKDEYIEFIHLNYQKKITNFDKAENKWNEKELPTLKDHNIDFKDTLK